MKPLTENEFLALSDLGNENKFQIVRIQEVMAFWKSGAEAAEIKTSGDVTLGRERELYKKALAQTKLTRVGIEFLQRKGKLYARRKKRDTKMASGLCPCCGGQLSNIRTNGRELLRHCYACHKEFPVDNLGNAVRRKEGETA